MNIGRKTLITTQTIVAIEENNLTIQYAQKQLKIRPKNTINLTKIVHIAQMNTDRIRILSGGEKNLL